MMDLSTRTYEEVAAHLDRVMARAQASWDARKAAEQEARDARRDELVARGLARAARGRIYDAIQLGHGHAS